MIKCCLRTLNPWGIILSQQQDKTTATNYLTVHPALVIVMIKIFFELPCYKNKGKINRS